MRNKVMGKKLFIAVGFVILSALPAAAEYGRIANNFIDPTVIKIDEGKFLGSRLDGGYEFLDGEGREFTLKELLDKPLLLVLSYYKCDGSCPVTNRELKAVLEGAGGVKPGLDYNVLTVSFDKDDDQMKLKMFVEEVALGGELKPHWKTALFKDPADIKRFTERIGYKFFWSKRDRLFIHPGVVVILSPEGRVMRYLYAANIDKTDISVAVAEARWGRPSVSKISEISDLLLLACFSYNFKEGRYTINYPLIISASSLMLGISLMVVSLVHFRKKVRRKRDV